MVYSEWLYGRSREAVNSRPPEVLPRHQSKCDAVFWLAFEGPGQDAIWISPSLYASELPHADAYLSDVTLLVCTDEAPSWALFNGLPSLQGPSNKARNESPVLPQLFLL